MSATALSDLIPRIAASAPLLYIGSVMVTDARAFVRIVLSIPAAFRAFPFARPEPPREPTALATAVARCSGAVVSALALLTLSGLLS
ncbi:MAG: hypothetical protein J0L64_06865 [Acidobacteria bacterium]|nr:hypothetical protein [Acidobacteriota bacterium]